VDVETTVRILEEMHGGRVSLRISAAGTGGNGGLNTVVEMIWDALPDTGQLASLGVSGHWPCAAHSGLAQHIWNGLLTLDHQIGKEYTQEELPK